MRYVPKPSQGWRSEPSVPDCLRETGIVKYRTTRYSWRTEFGDDLVAVRYENDFAGRCEPNVLAQPVF